MFARLRLVLCIILAAGVGYLLGSGPFSDWFEDLYNVVGVAWTAERLSRGSNGSISLLVAGYLLGQGIYLLIRQMIRRIGPSRTKRVEQVA